MRNRMTNREAAEIEKAVEVLEKAAGIEDKVANQNEKANNNWPVADKTKVASALVRLAQQILKV